VPVAAQPDFATPYTFNTLAGTAGYGSADGAPSAARFDTPSGVAVDSVGSLYVADTANHTIRMIGSDGDVSTLAGSPGKPGTADGVRLAARFNSPLGVCVGPGREVYVADTENHTVRRIAPGGFVSTVAGLGGVSGSADGPGTEARFYKPGAVAVDKAGSLYVADSANYTIRRIAPDGWVSTLAGSAGAGGSTDGGGAQARFTYPIGLAFDRTGNLYVGDGTIRKIAANGIVTTLAGSPAEWGSADGTGSAAFLDTAATNHTRRFYRATAP
jgi:sugar lactone lactonase YvrE